MSFSLLLCSVFYLKLIIYVLFIIIVFCVLFKVNTLSFSLLLCSVFYLTKLIVHVIFNLTNSDLNH